ncbi:hypothetical protein [Streptomyces syringium]|uniref:hypothetical protein n=1 Tax=Streptomyces syringium TaxID=76729 RepID=UPI0033F7A590
MMQVDTLWAYGIGAGYAIAGAGAAVPQRPSRPPWKALTRPPAMACLGLGLVFLPSGLWLLNRFPSWETMHVFPDPPPWLPTVFFITVLLCGLAGVLVTHWLLTRQRYWGACAQWLWPHLGMFYMIVNGWDGLGLRRFLAADPSSWERHKALPASFALALDWSATPVAATLATMILLGAPAMGALGIPLRAAAVRARCPGATPGLTRIYGALTISAIIPGPLFAVAAGWATARFGWWGVTASAIAAAALLAPLEPQRRLALWLVPAPLRPAPTTRPVPSPWPQRSHSRRKSQLRLPSHRPAPAGADPTGVTISPTGLTEPADQQAETNT